MLFENIIGGHL